jgi:hypothetical protein
MKSFYLFVNYFLKSFFIQTPAQSTRSTHPSSPESTAQQASADFASTSLTTTT